MKLYAENGYLDIPSIVSMGYPFTFIVGGRATGKTYGSLKYAVEGNSKFMYMRRTQTQIDIVRNDEMSPFKKLNSDLNWNIGFNPITKYTSGIYHRQLNEEGKTELIAPAIGYGVALSTFSNMRGFDASDVDLMIYDEFIPEMHERRMKAEGRAFLNAYETINRNRELEGKPPVQVICCSNSELLANPLFMELNLVRIADEMRNKKQEVRTLKERGILLILMGSSPISDQKADTALYKLNPNSDFNKMSLSNEFVSEEVGRIRTMPIVEYRPIVTVGEITIYKHKSRHEYYVSTKHFGKCPTFTSGTTSLKRFQKKYYWILEQYFKDTIIFEEFLCEVLLTEYYK